MKLSDYVAAYLAGRGIRHVFAVTGGASMHLIHALSRTPGITYICPQHEQAGAMAADAYARVTGGLGAAVATSGPGATNLMTGVCGAYFDSIPVVYITGQVSVFRLRRDSGVRQMGFQETEVVSMFEPVTKYAVMLEDPQRIRYELEKACYLATEGRPGPVLLDIPDNLQREDVDPMLLEPFVEPAPQVVKGFEAEMDRLCMLLNAAERPVVVLGWGIRLARAEKEALFFLDHLRLPVAPTWAVLDLVPSDHPLLIGPFGTHGTRYGNFAVQNADLVISLGARLDTRATGGVKLFARGAKLVVVDVDQFELGKFARQGRTPDLLVCADAKTFLQQLRGRMDRVVRRAKDGWHERIRNWKRQFPICTAEYEREKDVNPYVFVKALSRECREGDVLFSDTGCAIAWMAQAFDFKPGQRLFHDFNNTAMGYALPAAIGACFALNRKAILCVTGDGSLQMNIQEFATVIHHKLPIKIFLLNNGGYSMIQQTQDQWLESKYDASTVSSGLAFPDFERVADAYGFPTAVISCREDIARQIRRALDAEGPFLCDIRIRAERRVIPQVRFGRPLEDGDPLLERKEFLEAMIVPPAEISRQ